MKKLCSPKSEIELSFIKSILGSEGIEFYVRNDHFGGMYVGPAIKLLNEKAVFVPEDLYGRALELIADFRQETARKEESQERDTPGPWTYYLRLILEFLLFGWIMPRKRP